MTSALDLLKLNAIYTIDRQDGLPPKILEATAFLLWSGLHDLLNVYYPGWVTCSYKIVDLREEGTIFNRKAGVVLSARLVK